MGKMIMGGGGGKVQSVEGQLGVREKGRKENRRRRNERK